jgi:hypothetical protein
MIQFVANQPIQASWALWDISLVAEEFQAANGPATPLGEADRKKLFNFAERMRQFCEKLDLKEAKNRLDLFKTFLAAPELPYYCPSVCSELDGIKYAIEAELAERSCLLLSPDNSRFFHDKPLFGDRVDAALPSARNDIKSAGHCLALELYTAAVFHLMKAVEIGLRMLAKQRNRPAEPCGTGVASGSWTG